MTKIAYNNCFGGFSLSHEGIVRYAEIKGITLWIEDQEHSSSLLGKAYWTVPLKERPKELPNWHSQPMEARQAYNQAYKKARLYGRDISRTDPALIQTIEELGQSASGHYASLAIAEVPTGTQYRIDEYDGKESVMTAADYDWQTA
jgi:zona occludens toxin (predicted ATPase)